MMAAAQENALTPVRRAPGNAVANALQCGSRCTAAMPTAVGEADAAAAIGAHRQRRNTALDREQLEHGGDAAEHRHLGAHDAETAAEMVAGVDGPRDRDRTPRRTRAASAALLWSVESSRVEAWLIVAHPRLDRSS